MSEWLPSEVTSYVLQLNSSLAASDEDYFTAKINLKRALELIPEERVSANLAAPYKELGDIQLEKFEDDEGAIASYSTAIKMNPKDPDLVMSRGIAYGRNEEYFLAIEDFTLIIEQWPGRSFQPLINRGIAYGKLKDHETAVLDFSQAIEVDPTNVSGYYNRGIVYRFLKDHDSAISDFDVTIELDPMQDNAHVRRGFVHSIIGKPATAAADYQKALEINSANDDAQYFLGQLQGSS